MQQPLVEKKTEVELGEEIYRLVVEPILKQKTDLLRLMANDGRNRVRIIEFNDVDDAYLLWCYVEKNRLKFLDVDVRMCTVDHVFIQQYTSVY